MRTTAFHDAMLRLALAAIVLLATLPTLGRLADRGAAAGDAGWAAMCTSAGLTYVRLPGLPSALDAALHGKAPGQPAHPHDGDCDYCPLLAALVVVALWALFAADLRPRSGPSRRIVSPHAVRRHPCGLGSRGPPIAL